MFEMHPEIVGDNEVRLVSKFKVKSGKEYPIGDVWFKQRRNSDVVMSAVK